MTATERDGMTRDKIVEDAPRLALALGLGLCWSSEELVAFCVSGLAAAGESTYLYTVYLPLLALAGLALAMAPGISSWVLRPATRVIALACGVLGVLVLALFPDRSLAVFIGVALYASGVAVVNVLWMRAFTASSARDMRRSIVMTAVATMLSLVFWQIGNAGALLAAAVLLALSIGAYGLSSESLDEGTRVSGVTLAPSGMKDVRRWSAPVGVLILMVGFGFIQYTAYHYGAPEIRPISWEVFSHGLAVALLAGAVYGPRDGEQALGFKIATTLMLFSFVLLAVLWPSVTPSAALAAATEGMLELVMLLALVEYARSRGIRSVRPFGLYLVLVAVAQLVGCGLAVLDHMLLPSASYSMVGLALVACFIVTAIWLLNDKTIAAFLWEGLARGEGDSVGSDRRQTFDDRAQAVAEAFALTARETEVMALFAKGRSSSFIAEEFCVSNNTIRSHILHLYAKCDVHSRQELITLIDAWE